LKELKPKVPILIYSMYSEEQFGLRAIQSGADGFLPKDSDVEEIPKAVQCLLEGKRYIRESLAAVLVGVARGGSTQLGSLSDREEQVLRMMAEGRTVTQIAGKLALSVKSVGTYRGRILEKLGLQTTADLIRYAMEHGYT
jgi:two-component system invasion response regulator UvrY